MEPLDGNAIAGTLMAIFGTDMTTATAACAGCGRCSLVGELDVYLRAPGTVVRCGHCENVAMVVVEAHRAMCVDLSGIVALQLVE
jgi:hypothetical protein